MAEADELAVLQAAVTLARSEQVGSIDVLEARLIGRGFSKDEIAKAVRTWADYYARHHYQP